MTVHVARLQLNTETDNPEVPKAVGTSDCCLAYDYHCLARGGTDECEGMFYFVSELFRFEELAFEPITPGFYRIFLLDVRSENLVQKSFVLELHGESSELAMSALP